MSTTPTTQGSSGPDPKVPARQGESASGAGPKVAGARSAMAKAVAARMPGTGSKGGSPAAATAPEGAAAAQVADRPSRPAAVTKVPVPGGAAATAPGAPARATPRRVRLTLSRVDPWSVMKIAFLLSVGAAIAGVVMVALMWLVLAGMGVFSAIEGMFGSLESGGSSFDIMDYIGFGRMVSLAVVIGVMNILLLTALATLAAFLYNLSASLVGGVQMTLSDE